MDFISVNKLFNIAKEMRKHLLERIAIVTLADQCIVSATNFLTGIIIGRVCTKEQFGLYVQVR